MNAVRMARTAVTDTVAEEVSQSPPPTSNTSLAVAATPSGRISPRSSGYATPGVLATNVVETARSSAFAADVLLRVSVAAGMVEQAAATSTSTSTAVAVRTPSRTPPSSFA